MQAFSFRLLWLIPFILAEVFLVWVLWNWVREGRR
jgi:ABC-type glucose/galactose transport system permease subunit